jgi:tRNA 2-thiocytidine biosynthesis protein TtcA
VGYSTPLESRIARKVTKAIHDFNLIEDGDRVMVGLSGGKDSWALIQILDVLRKRAPITFSIIAVNIDSGYEDYQHSAIKRTCEERGWECHVQHTSIGAVMDDLLAANATPCSLCARLRRGALYKLADQVGATKIALGHHADDFIETLLLNLFFEGSLKAMPARLVSDDQQHIVIRPLVYVAEPDCRDYAKAKNLPIIGCCCPACGDLSLQRQRIKQLLMDLEREHVGVKQSMLRALANVAPRHLLDTRLNPAVDVISEHEGNPLLQIRIAERETAKSRA